MNQIILTTPDELRSLITDTVREAIRTSSSNQPDGLQTSPVYLTATQAAKYLNIAKQTLYGYTSDRKIPFIKKPKGLLFLKSDLDDWLQGRKKDSVAQIKATLRGEEQKKG